MSSLAYDLRGIEKSFKVGDTDLSILKSIDLQIPMGQFLAIMGPSGSGKSTLMNILGCLETPSRGTMFLLGNNAYEMPDDEVAALRCRTLGFVFQRFHLLPCYDATANVALAMTYSGRPDRVDRAKRLLDKFGLGHRLHHRPLALSGGEQQRVAIARAVANDPPILLADEPTGALDQTNGRAILDLICSFHRQARTIVLVTHDPSVAARAERVIEMVDGQIRRDIRNPKYGTV